jgi:hypothetical protein
MPRPGARRCCSATPSARRSASCTACRREHRADRRARRRRAAERGVPRGRRRAAADLARERPGVDAALLKRALVLAPPSAQGTPWMKRFGNYADAFASGWMQLRGTRRRRGVDRGFVMSDHADWPGLQQGHCRHGRRARVRHARQRAGDGAVADRDRAGCPRLQDRVRRRGRPGSSRVFRRRAGEGANGARCRTPRARFPAFPRKGKAPRHEGLRRAVPRARRQHVEPRQAGRPAALPARCRPGRRRMGRLLSRRRQAAPAGAHQAAAPARAGSGGPARVALRRKLRRRRRPGRDHRAAVAAARPKRTTSGLPRGSSSTCCLCALRRPRPNNWPTVCARSGASSRPRSGWCTSSSSPARFAWACRSCRSRRRWRRWAASTPSASRSASWATRTSARGRSPPTTAR